MNNRRILSLTLCVALWVCALAVLHLLAGDPARARNATRHVAPTGADVGDCTEPNS